MNSNPHTIRAFDEERTQLRERITRMGELAGQALHDAVECLLANDVERASQIVARDQDIDAMADEVEQFALTILALRSPVADDLAVVFLPLLPAGLYELLRDLGVRLVEVPESEYPTLACNVLAVRPGIVIVAEGNPLTRRRLEAAGVEVHAIPLGEVGENGSGGVTCLTRPVRRG